MTTETATNPHPTTVMRLLLAATQTHQADLARAMGRAPSTITRRFESDNPRWSFAEIEDAARFFKVPVERLFQDPADVLLLLGLDPQNWPEMTTVVSPAVAAARSTARRALNPRERVDSRRVA